jgi:Conserved hypothetical ATP binding protein
LSSVPVQFREPIEPLKSVRSSDFQCCPVFQYILTLLCFSFVQLTVIHLVDAHLCCDPGKYISALLLSLSTMLHLELPHINVLSKIDLIENYGKLGMHFFCHQTLFSFLFVCLLVPVVKKN